MPGPIGKKLCMASLCIAAAVAVNSSHAELAAEQIPNVAKISPDYPQSFIFAHDANFDALLVGRVVLLDVAAETYNYKGALDAAQFASFTQSATRNELYVAETFYSRGTRGVRTDMVTIYDKEHLKPIAEIALPGGKRGQMVSNRYTLQLVDNDRYLFLFNFTPAASVSMIDIASRTILSETPIPGCSLIYPTGKRGFSSLCSNGSMFTAQFDEKGQLTKQETIPSFFSVDDDPLFDKPVYLKGTAYFPSYQGQMQAIDLSGDTPKVAPAWSLLTDAERSENWRPGGWQIATVSPSGQIYVLMHRDGAEGSHKNGGSEVWVFDPSSKKRVKRIELKEWGVSIEVTGGKNPYLVVTNGDMQLDVYAASSGKWLKMIGGAAAMPYNLHALR
jgi:methylamine dehydrogenase heavy chain